MGHQVVRLFAWPRLLVALLLAPVVAFGVDRLLLAPSCPPCHTEVTAELPRLDDSIAEGLVRIPANGMEFRARVAGRDNRDGEGVILLHGYPETSIMWRPALARLAKSGYRAIAFDQRGYSPGARPRDVASYTADKLAGDVIAVADAAGFDRFHLVGHDWGGMLGWIAAARYPHRIATWTALSTPHPAAYREALSLLGGGDQLRRSSYMLLNWIPWLSELVLGFDRAAFLRHFSWREMAHELRREYVGVFSEPGALKAVLHWYLANRFLVADDFGKTRQPTFYLWGNKDKSLGRVGAEKTADYVDGPFRFMKLDAGHSLMAEMPDVVSREIVAHLSHWKIPKRRRRSGPPSLAEAYPEAAHCSSSKPHCLKVNVSPVGTFVKFVNKCTTRYSGYIRMRCPKWRKQAFIDIGFDFAPGGVMTHSVWGHVLGECYYNQLVCAANGEDDARQSLLKRP